MAKKVPRRDVNDRVERELWARAAGRCEFAGCNRLLYKSPVTQESVNISEKAHIYSFAPRGPRGQGPHASNRRALNSAANLLLVCHDCHKKIDGDPQGIRYSASLLQGWKEEHERRVALVTGISPSKKSHVVLYGANIGHETSKLKPDAAMNALFPDWYPASESALALSMSWEGKDSDDSYWQTEEANLRTAFERRLRPLLEEGEPNHYSFFGLAPMPLLTLFGTLVTDKFPAQVYQLRREPVETWKWGSRGPGGFGFIVKRPKSCDHRPALVISLSDSISYDRVTSVMGSPVSIWELTISEPHNDFLKSKRQLSAYRETVRKLMVEIGKAHGKSTMLSIFPAMPVACAIELGRVRMPKADGPWDMYDQNNLRGRFIYALTIGGNNG